MSASSTTKPKETSKKQLETAVSLRRTPAGWVVSTIQLENGKETSRKETEPEVRMLALEYLQREIGFFWELEG